MSIIVIIYHRRRRPLLLSYSYSYRCWLCFLFHLVATATATTAATDVVVFPTIVCYFNTRHRRHRRRRSYLIARSTVFDRIFNESDWRLTQAGSECTKSCIGRTSW